MPTPTLDPREIDAFIQRWQNSGAAERANFAQFAVELCDLIDVPRPDPATPIDAADAYVFEKSVPLPAGTTGRIDLYRRGCFVLEAKQGRDPLATTSYADAISQREVRVLRERRRGTATRGTPAWDTAMERAREQAQSYARNLPAHEINAGRPPFLIVVDVGNTIELFAEFSRSGGNYVPFPDPGSYRLTLGDLHDADTRELLRQVWLDPIALDPARRSTRVTREIADRLARLARSLEGDHSADAVAHFLMRCLFTMFAEDVGLLSDRSFTELLTHTREDIRAFTPLLSELWGAMRDGGYSVGLRAHIPHVNGFLFAETDVLALNRAQVQLLIEAAQADWRDVEPAIFGTLLERALNPQERHKLGAHFTPRAYVERLVQPTVIEPLRERWNGVKVAATQLAAQGKNGAALDAVDGFHRRLASVRILDPACGSGNFLYVTLELLKRLEGEVINAKAGFGGQQSALALEGFTVSPQQFLGIEVNPRAAAIAELVLWIGYLQWQLRMDRDISHLPTPIIKNYQTIACRDAVLAWDSVEPLLDAAGAPVTRWDGRTTKPHPVTGREVPDAAARVQAWRYLNPRPAAWPEADFIVGNPPFIGTALMREALGDGYTEALRATYKQVPNSADYVMYWWDKAAALTAAGAVQRFGFITTNSLRQVFNRRVLERHMSGKKPVSLLFAIPDHPWVDSADGADVRIAMTVAALGEREGRLSIIVHENTGDADGVTELEFIDETGIIFANLSIGANVALAQTLKANSDVSSRGFELGSSGFIVTRAEANQLGLGQDASIEKYIREYRNGRDIANRPRGVLAIQLAGYDDESALQRDYPAMYQWLKLRVFPQRAQNRDPRLRKYWWLHRRSREELRQMLYGVDRYIATVETSKHRFFVFLDESILPDNKLVAIALDDAYYLGVLSSSIHVNWALRSGGWLGVGNDPVYVKTKCFETFPFPAATPDQQVRIRDLAERLDAHRKRQQAQHPTLTMTGMYNVLAKLRTGDPLTANERAIHEQGLVSVLRQLHDELDAAVFAAYGWPLDLADEEILQRLVDLNAERASEEAAGHVRWLRPAYQAPDEVQPTQATLIDDSEASASLALVKASATPRKWPSTLPEQAQAVRAALAAGDGPVAPAEIAGIFGRRTKKRVAEVRGLLDTLVALGQAQRVEGGRYVGQ